MREHDEAVHDEVVAHGIHTRHFPAVLGLHQELVLALLDEAVHVGGQVIGDGALLDGQDVQAGEGLDDGPEVHVLTVHLHIGDLADEAEHGGGDVHGFDIVVVGVLVVEGAPVLGEGGDARQKHRHEDIQLFHFQ